MCLLKPDTELHLGPDLTAPSAAREFLRQGVCPKHSASVLDASVLLVSELVTNAIVHGAPPVVLRLRCDESTGLQVSVTDGDPRPPVLRHAGLQEESGRGVALVDVLSSAWGIEPHEAGKTIWFTLRP